MIIALSETEQHYLKTIYLLQKETGQVTTRQLAERLGIRPASVSAMIKHLAEDEEGAYVAHTPYQHIELTGRGRSVAIELVRHQRLLELFFVTTLDMPWDEVRAEAERLAPIISENLEAYIAKKLGNPSRDPHGDPIPTPEGVIDDADDIQFSSLDTGTRALVVRVPDDEPELLRYLASLGITPGSWITLENRAPYGDILMVRSGTTSQPLAGEIARQILVSASSCQKP
jgi:DtxR family transcriptional regulator, Mn-dependent transcriptional regulator